MNWYQASGIKPKKYICGFCNSSVASAQGYCSKNDMARDVAYIYICPNCNGPTFTADSLQIPGVAFGNTVENLPEDIKHLYAEARDAASVNANTAAVLCCRKLLMNIAVNHGAKEGESFVTYVDFLANKGYIPPNGRGWVDHIREKGNEATHEIRLMEQAEAEGLITFAEMLLKFIYEFPNKVPKKQAD